MRNRKAMKYFSGSTFQRLPLYKLAMGGVAMLLCAGIGASAMAAAFIGVPAQAPMSTAVPVIAEPISTQETAATPAPTPTPAPDVEVYSEVSVVQQDIGIQLYQMVDLPQAEPGTTTAQTISVQNADADNAVEGGKLPLTGVAMDITITPVPDTENKTSDSDQTDAKPLVCPMDTKTGSVLAEDVTPGLYTITFPEVEGYHMPADVTVTVLEKVEYKADVEAVKDKIVQATEVVESQEDSSYGGDTVVEEQIVDTVSYADPSKVETGRTTVYTAKLSANGHLLLKDGTATAYLPVYDDNHVLTGAKRDAMAASTLAAGGQLSAVGLAGLFRHGSNAPVTAPETSPAAEEPTVREEETEQPSPSPETTPQGTPTPPKDPTAGWPGEIKAADLAGYGFDVSSEEKITYQYTGWQVIDGKNYYYDPTSHQPVTGTQVIQGNVYDFAADGALNQTARGIDVSKYQGNIDWNAVAADGITFAIIRVGYRGYGSGALVEDSTFRRNIQGATAAGLKVGVYFYSQAINEAEAVEEASMVISLCQGYGLPLGVYYDTEKVAGDTGRADGISAAERTACAVAFCETIRNAGYSAGVYSYASWFYNSLNYANISKYKIWIAQYRDSLDFNYRYDIWQYTSTGKVNGVPGGVDMNIG